MSVFYKYVGTKNFEIALRNYKFQKTIVRFTKYGFVVESENCGQGLFVWFEISLLVSKFYVHFIFTVFGIGIHLRIRNLFNR